MIHKKLKLTNEHFDRFKSNLNSVLEEMDKPTELIELLMGNVENYRELIVSEYSN
jgi:truncated hemoglobin YjbI